ncbi:MAG: TolC family protein [Pseudomonadota bacterium]|nr:TolC family protein [Pseudomonadota bacterium]
MSFRHFMAAVLVVGAAGALPALAAPCGQALSAPNLDVAAPLSLERVLDQVRTASPDVLASALEIRARGEEAEQAGKWTNPSLSLEVENFAGTGSFQGFDDAETTLAVGQTLRLGNKRRLEQQAARSRQMLGEAECAVLLREAELEAALAYADLVAAIETRALAKEAATLGETLAEVSRKRVEAGEAAPPDLARARADAARLKAEASGASALVEQTGYMLAALWGASELENIASASAIALSDGETEAPSGEHPRLKAAEAAEALGQRLEAFEAAQALPDLDVSAGLKRFEATGDSALVAGVSVALPIFDRNRNAAAAARYRTDAARVSAQGVEARLLAEQRSAIARLKAAETRLGLLREEALPSALQAFDAALQGYRIGRFDLDQTINARSALVETQLALIAAERERNRASLTLRSLIGAYPFTGEN